MSAHAPPALRAALRAYRGVPGRDRLQVHVRRWSAPLPALEALVPPRGRVLDVGCGRGLIASYLALAAPGREVTGIDIDPRKIRVAETASGSVTAAGGSVTFRCGDGSELPPGPFDAIVFAEMLYLLSVDHRHDLLERAVASLAPGGILVVKEVDATPRWKHAVNSLSSYVDMRLLHNLDGEQVLNLGPGYYAGLLGDLGLEVSSYRLDRWYPFAHFVVTGRRPGAAPAPG